MAENVPRMKIGIKINVGMRAKKHHVCEKDYIWNPATCSCENSKYVGRIVDDAVVTCDEIIRYNKKCSSMKYV